MATTTPIIVENPTASDCVQAASHLYRHAKPLNRFLMTHRPRICPFEELIPLVPSGSSVLDIGCGGGLMLSLLAASGRINRGVGLDTNAAMIRLATDVASRHDLPLQYSENAFGAGIPQGSFDVVTIIDVLHHVPTKQQRDFFNEAATHVPVGGTLIYKDMCKRPMWRASANRLHDLAMARQWINYCPIEKVKQWAINHGLECATTRCDKRFWYGHELLVLKRPEG